jgi:excisionase family DNA binding protein
MYGVPRVSEGRNGEEAMYAEQTNPGVQYTYGLPKVMTVEEAAEFLRINVKTLYAAVESKDVPALKLGKRIVILRDALLDSLRGKKFVRITGKRSA